MTELLERAVATVKALQAEQQDEIARLMLLLADADPSPTELTPEEDAALIAPRPPRPAASSRATSRSRRSGRSMAVRLRFTTPAAAELDEVLTYIESDSAVGASSDDCRTFLHCSRALSLIVDSQMISLGLRF